MTTLANNIPLVNIPTSKSPKENKHRVHPLDTLSPEEITQASTTIKEYFGASAHVRFCQLNLYEPHKELVTAFEEGKLKSNQIRREAFSIVMERVEQKVYELIVALHPPEIIACTHIPGVQPNIMSDEYQKCEDLVKSDPRVIEAMKRRGITDMSKVIVELWSGFFSHPSRRMANPLLYLKTDEVTNPYSRPIEGLEILVDLGKFEIAKVTELFDVPVPPYDPIAQYKDIPNPRTDLKPLDVVQPEGPSFTVQGNLVQWQNWSFRIGFTETEGLVLHRISYDDGGKVRPLFFRASCVEMVVPYGDPRHPNFLKNAFDAGEDGLGRNANSLELGCDCLGTIYYFDAILADVNGNPYTIKNAVCMHEEDYGILWKHKDWRSGEAEMRRSRKLVVSFFTSISNYDYGFFWYFFQDGNIKMEAKLTGILSTSAIKDNETPGGYGTMIAPNLYGPIHQHFFTVRLDTQIDGDNNTVQEVNVRKPSPSEYNPYRSAFKAVFTPLKSESEAQRNCSAAEARYWKIVNPTSKNRSGELCGYKLIPGPSPVPFADDESKIVQRAGFLKKNLWVTPFNAKEKFPAGNYPFQKEIEDGLPLWTKTNRNVNNTDIVVWYNFGITHVTRSEDWPIMPTEYCGFALKPDNFFNYSPAMDVPKPNKVSPHQQCCQVRARL